MTDQTDFEELEQIPWAALAAKPADPRARYGAIAVVAVLVIGVLVWLAMRGARPAATLGVADSAPSSEVSTAAVIAPATPVATDEIPIVASVSSPPEVYSEADLMLIDEAEEKRLAVMHAEWLVRDYLTVDGDAAIASRMTRLLPDVERDENASYVEWVETFAVHSPEPGEYRVEMVYRVLRGGDDGYVREPTGAMAVSIAIDVDGSAQLLVAPEVVDVPVLMGLAPGS